MGWEPIGRAPREIEQLATFLDAQLSSLSIELERSYNQIFPIWAEENAALGVNAYEWAFGNGADTASGLGLVLPFRCGLIALSLSLSGAAARAKVEVERDGTIEPLYAIDLTSSNQGYQDFYIPLEFSAGSILNFRTVSQTSTAASNVICAWMQKE